MVYRSAQGKVAALDFREKAAGMASRDMYLDSAGNPITEKSLNGHLAAGVPGSVDGMVQAHAKCKSHKRRIYLQSIRSFCLTGLILRPINLDITLLQRYISPSVNGRAV